MAPPRPLRLLIVTLSLATVAGSSLLAAPSAGASGARHDRLVEGPASRGPALAGGESGTGMPAPPSVIPPSAERRAAARPRVRWSDVGGGYWARNAIDYVGATHGWMRDYPAGNRGRYQFHPGKIESRKLFFRAAVEAFAPNARVDHGLRFSDLPAKAPFYRYANIAVGLGWVDRGANRSINPDKAVTMSTVHHVLVFALGLKQAASGLNRIHMSNGTRFHTWKNFGTTVIGMRIGLRYNHSTESMDVNPNSPMPRSEVAWSLYRAKTVASYTLDSMKAYEHITLPNMNKAKRKIVEWGIRYAGYPYVWGGEWPKATSGGYCCGAQPTGGFDCSGLTWWLIKAQAGTWDPTPPRPYRGWSLPQRASADMARYGHRISWHKKQAGDLLFYDGDGNGSVDHVDTYIGNGWALDSSSSAGGVTIMWVGTGWYHDHFKHARRIVN
jgi:hypothetical protein